MCCCCFQCEVQSFKVLFESKKKVLNFFQNNNIDVENLSVSLGAFFDKCFNILSLFLCVSGSNIPCDKPTQMFLLAQ